MWNEELIKAGGSKSEHPLTEQQTLPFVKCWIKIAAMTNIGKFNFKSPSILVVPAFLSSFIRKVKSFYWLE